MTSQTITTRGVMLSAAAALLWAFVPVYIGVLGDVDTAEIVAHRALWSAVILLGLVIVMPQMTGGVTRVRKSCRIKACAAGCWRPVRC